MSEKAKKNTVSKELKAVRRRRAYVSTRLPKIKEELKALKLEQQELKSGEKGAPGTREAKAIKRKRLFVSERLLHLKQEKQVLKDEKTQMKSKKKSEEARDAH